MALRAALPVAALLLAARAATAQPRPAGDLVRALDLPAAAQEARAAGIAAADLREALLAMAAAAVPADQAQPVVAAMATAAKHGLAFGEMRDIVGPRIASGTLAAEVVAALRGATPRVAVAAAPPPATPPRDTLRTPNPRLLRRLPGTPDTGLLRRRDSLRADSTSVPRRLRPPPRPADASPWVIRDSIRVPPDSVRRKPGTRP
jgi:hypothetical protein